VSRRDTWTRVVPVSPDGDNWVTCSGCGGNGQVRNPYFPQKWDTCSRCGGTGEVQR
jgi:DnaJ-class molecular chaperone